MSFFLLAYLGFNNFTSGELPPFAKKKSPGELPPLEMSPTEINCFLVFLVV